MRRKGDIALNIDSTLAILRRERLLLEHAPHSAQFQDLTTCLLRIFSAARVIPALSPQEVQMYASLALLHDVGKQTIPGEVLNKPGPLTREEFEIMKSHTTQGCGVLERVPGLCRCEAFPLI